MISASKQYPNWEQTPQNVKEEILEIAFANGDFIDLDQLVEKAEAVDVENQKAQAAGFSDPVHAMIEIARKRIARDTGDPGNHHPDLPGARSP